ncbi:MAG TPA: uracil-DNA glycosylase [Steroidobacteraceae bacterium]|jgi:uracil-DNA glycosylase family 4|nr:uracil-DNA glycosylase [Steroidobacteraceae bacterium]
MNSIFDSSCRRCPRLAAFLDSVKHENPDYYCKPVPPFGDPEATILIVGLAPGMHGANRTGRPFTGDHAGILLYGTLHKLGLASRAASVDVADGLRLQGARITNSVKCLPPANKPLPLEIRNCNAYLAAELAQSPGVRVIVALGAVAHAAVLRAVDRKSGDCKFAHGAQYALGAQRVLLDSYHCSRYNTQTRRLTAAMFEEIMQRALALAGGPMARGDERGTQT